MERRDPVEIVPYDAGWPGAFDRERRRVDAALGPLLVRPVEHIGSTAVPGLPAKPIVDMLALVADYDATADVADALAGIGWVPAPEPGDEHRRRRSFCFPSVARRTHHLHVWEEGSAWRPILAFRDHLRAHPADATEYGRLKAELAAAHRDDRPAYRAGKAPFIEAVLGTLT